MNRGEAQGLTPRGVQIPAGLPTGARPLPPACTPTPPSEESETLSPETTESDTLIDADAEAVDEVGNQAFGVTFGPEQQEHDVAWAGAQFLAH